MTVPHKKQQHKPWGGGKYSDFQSHHTIKFKVPTYQDRFSLKLYQACKQTSKYDPFTERKKLTESVPNEAQTLDFLKKINYHKYAKELTETRDKN